jgi:hypothetical protein
MYGNLGSLDANVKAGVAGTCKRTAYSKPFYSNCPLATDMCRYPARNSKVAILSICRAIDRRIRTITEVAGAACLVAVTVATVRSLAQALAIAP